MQDHYKIILEGSSNLRCEHPKELHGHSFIALPSQNLCDVPIVIRIAIQDIQTYSVIVSWQSRYQNGLNGYRVAYFGDQNPNVVSIFVCIFYKHENQLHAKCLKCHSK